MSNIIAVKFLDAEGQPRGREYSYYSNEPAEPGQYAMVPVAATSSHDEKHTQKVLITKTDVPEEAIAPFKDRVKTILGIWKEEENNEGDNNHDAI